jgi:anti-sigma-K factor RskA
MTERLTHQELQRLLGAYVLGGLDAADRRLVDEHLAACTQCREELAHFAAVPGLLRLAPAPPEPHEPPEDSLPRLIAAARFRRAKQVRQRFLLAAAAVVLVLAGVLAVVVDLRGATPPPATDTSVAVVSAFDAHEVGSAQLRDKAWGTEVHLDLVYNPPDARPYTAWAIDRAGHAEQAATWGLAPNGRCSVTGATSIHRDELARIEVRTADGRTVFRTG